MVVKGGLAGELAVFCVRSVTNWTSYLWLLAAPSSYLFALALSATVIAKTISLQALHPPVEWWALPASMLLDVVVFMGATGTFAWLEAYTRFAGWLTVPVAAAVSLVAALNATYLALAGEQLSWSIFEIVVRQWAEAETVLRGSITPVFAVWLVLVVALLSGVSIALRLLLRHAGPWDRVSHGRARACCAWLFAVPAAILSYALPTPSSVDAYVLGKNAFVTIARTATNRFEKGSFAGYQHKRLVSDATIDAFASGERPNVLFYILEATRYDYTSLAPAEMRQAETPVLARLAARGVVGHQVRVVVPRSIKSMFSLLCARLPTMQQGVIEISHDPRLQCLPSILRRAGYRTAYFQGSFGTFEQWPRLIEKFGYEHFEAWEDLQARGEAGEVLGYFASEDEPLAPALARWLDASDSASPFFATILTSAAHHPYQLPRKLRSRLAKEGKPLETPVQRYARLVEESDRVLGLVLDVLREREVLGNTLILVVGDHGQGFAEHGVRQNNNNYFEGGLRVPLVLAGPGIAPGRVDHNLGLIDITPTLLAHWDMEIVPELRGRLLGRDFLEPGFDTRGLPRFFGCYSFLHCRGFVVDQRKLVYQPWNDKTWVFDLAADPDERQPVVADDTLLKHVERLHDLIDGHRTSEWPMVYKEVRYRDWLCPEGLGLCLHPQAAEAKYRSKTKGKSERTDEDPSAKDTVP